MNMFLIRHGQSIQNTKENYKIKLPDNLVYLTEKGKQEANDAGIFLKEFINKNNINLQKAVLYISPYKRTRETATIINKYLKSKDVFEDITLIEQQYGLFSDKEIELIKKLYPEQFTYYDNYYQNKSKFYAKLPQGESPFDVALRTRQFLNMISMENIDNLFVVSHGTTIRTILMNYYHYNVEWFDKTPKMENCSICYVDELKDKEEYIYGGPVKKLKK